MESKTGKNIIWSDDERKRISFAVYYYLKVNKTASLLQAINNAQNIVLPVYRRRTIKNISSIKWLTDELDFFIRNENEKDIDHDLSKQPTDNLINELLSRFESKLNINNLLNNLEKKIETKIIDRISKLENMIIESSILHNSSQETTIIENNKTTKKRKKILIVGLLYSQFNEIKTEYSEYFDLKNFVSEGSIPKLKSMLSYIDTVIIMTNFVPHSVDGVISQSNAKYIRISGGVSSLKEELDKHI